MPVVQHSLVGMLFTLGAGGVFIVALAAYLGRLPVLFAFQVVSLGTGVWCAVATSFESFMAARIINGFFATLAQAVSLNPFEEPVVDVMIQMLTMRDLSREV